MWDTFLTCPDWHVENVPPHSCGASFQLAMNALSLLVAQAIASWKMLHSRSERRHSNLLQSLQFPLPFHEVLVIPLNLARLREPPLEVLGDNLIVRRVPGFCRLESALGFKARLVEGLA